MSAAEPSKKIRLIALATTLTAVVVFFLPAPDGVPATVMPALGLCLFAVGLYATVAIPEHITALMFFAIAMVVGISSPSVVFSGFHATAFWLVAGGLVIGVAVHKTGLGAWIATQISSRLRGGYPTMVFGVAVVGFVMIFIMPATMGRVVLLIPVVLALCDHNGFKAGSRERTGLVLVMTFVTWMPATAVLPANVPNMVLVGVAENFYGFTFQYVDYFIANFPVNALLRAVLIVGLVFILYPSSGNRTLEAAATPQTSMPADAKKLAWILAITLGFWITDFIHGISPAWIAVMAAVVLLFPKFGVLNDDDIKQKFNFAICVYTAGILALGAVLVDTGAADWAGGWLLAKLPLSPEAPLTSLYSMVGLGTVLNLGVTAAGVPAIVGPLAGDIAELSGIPVRTVLLSQVLAYSFVLLPYQVPPLVLALYLGGISPKEGAKMTVLLLVLALIVMVPANYAWWSFIGLM